MALRAVGSGNYMRRMFYAENFGTGGSGPVTRTPNSILLMHFDGTNGSTTFTDVYGHTQTILSGSPSISTAQSKFGGASFLCPNTSALISVGGSGSSGDWAFSGDFTVECWIYPINTGSTLFVCGAWTSGVATQSGWIVQISTAQHLIFTYGIGSSNVNIDSGAANITYGTWQHIAAVRSSGTITQYVNGVAQPTTASVVGTLNTSLGLVVGGYTPSNPGYQSYIDEFAISTVARYTSNFTPAGPFAN